MAKMMNNAEVRRMVDRISAIISNLMKEHRYVAAAYPAFDPRSDVRLVPYLRVKALCDSLLLTLCFLGKYLMDPAWWKQMMQSELTREDAADQGEGFERFIKVGFVISLFSVVESSFRLLLRSLDPNACARGLASFKNIYDCLLTTKLSGCPSESIELLDLLRHARNTIHNNGMFFDASGKDRTVQWRGTTYRFGHASPVGFVDWDFIFLALEGIIELFRAVMTDRVFHSIPFTKDPHT